MKSLLAPLSWLYGAALALRHALYDHHLLPSHKVSVATICVGNLAVGGTGKTPMVEYLIRLLSPHYKIAVLSRGYGRKTSGFVLADHEAKASTIGDEPMQIHTKFPHIPLAVCENRVRGVKQLQRMVDGLQVVILDDAFQHRRIRCGYYILLTPYDQLYIHDHLLPWGRLRDLPSRSLKANSIVVTQCPPTMRPIDCRVIDNQLHLPTYQHLFFSQVSYPSKKLDGVQKVLVLTGIAQPDYFMDHIRSLYPTAQLLSFPDHHRFSKKDIARIASTAAHYDAVFTTEKDYQRLAETSLVDTLCDKLFPIAIETTLRGDKLDFNQEILKYVSQHL